MRAVLALTALLALSATAAASDYMLPVLLEPEQGATLPGTQPGDPSAPQGSGYAPGAPSIVSVAVAAALAIAVTAMSLVALRRADREA